MLTPLERTLLDALRLRVATEHPYKPVDEGGLGITKATDNANAMEDRREHCNEVTVAAMEAAQAAIEFRKLARSRGETPSIEVAAG